MSESKISPNDLWEIIQDLHTNKDDFEEGDLYDRVHACLTYELMDIPVKLLDAEEWATDEYKIEKYVNMNSENMPPIVIHSFGNGYSIVDGTHRLNAQIKLKKETIRAYVGNRR